MNFYLRLLMRNPYKILQKSRKYISFSLILNLLFFSSGQAYIFRDCICDHSESKAVESIDCCGKVVEIEVEEPICCSSEPSNAVVKFESTTSHDCEDCSTGCSLDENIEFSSTTLFASTSFSLKKLGRVEIEYFHLNSEKFNTSDINNKFVHIQNDEIPKLFGKNLLIQIHTLKIPLILV